ncbi:MAG TPA: DUF6167 family protein [Nocardioidaceae bacterium]|nr:DUF6167 family protein [Nocardioidaceae bacterium]
MNKGLWFVAGSAAGAYAVTRARRTAEAFTYDGLHDRLSGLFVGARLFGAEVKHGAAEKETELRERLELMPTDRSLEVEAARPLRLVGGSAAAEPTRSTHPTLKGNND